MPVFYKHAFFSLGFCKELDKAQSIELLWLTQQFFLRRSPAQMHALGTVALRDEILQAFEYTPPRSTTNSCSPQVAGRLVIDILHYSAALDLWHSELDYANKGLYRDALVVETKAVATLQNFVGKQIGLSDWGRARTEPEFGQGEGLDWWSISCEPVGDEKQTRRKAAIKEYTIDCDDPRYRVRYTISSVGSPVVSQS
jgi:hypothetical protein